MAAQKPSTSDRILDALAGQAFSERLWRKDPTIWRQGPKGAKVIANRLGWLNVAEVMRDRIPEMVRLADDVKAAGFKHAVLMGMGGSSLSPEVSRLTFGVRKEYPDLMVLDSTVPEAVLRVERSIDLAKTLFIVAMKSGATVETNSCYQYFFEKVRAGSSFVAITDPGTSLEAEAKKNGFRRVFLNLPDIGGRYSALSYFGLVPAAIIGADIALLLDRASEMVDLCGPEIPPADNPAIGLGVFMAEHALAGRDKLTVLLSPEIRGFGSWVEQLVAESTGKSGTGILPVEGESLASPDSYGDDRAFVYTRLNSARNGESDAQVGALEKAGFPVFKIDSHDVYDLGREYYRWEMATAVAGALLGVNPFDEPNVKESKDNTKRLIGGFERNGSLPTGKPIISEDGISLYCDPKTRSALDAMRGPKRSLGSYLRVFLSLHQPGNYFALMAFLAPSPSLNEAFETMRTVLRDRFKVATTLGYGPRFLHSTGQFHKGGPNNGIFIQFTADDAQDAPIPGKVFSFGILKQAQALGDAVALQSKGRPFLRIHLGPNAAAGLKRVLEVV